MRLILVVEKFRGSISYKTTCEEISTIVLRALMAGFLLTIKWRPTICSRFFIAYHSCLCLQDFHLPSPQLITSQQPLHLFLKCEFYQLSCVYRRFLESEIHDADSMWNSKMLLHLLDFCLCKYCCSVRRNLFFASRILFSHNRFSDIPGAVTYIHEPLLFSIPTANSFSFSLTLSSIHISFRNNGFL